MELVFKRPEIHMCVHKKRRQPDLSEIFYRRDATKKMENAWIWSDLIIPTGYSGLDVREYAKDILEVVGHGGSTRKHFACHSLNAAAFKGTVTTCGLQTRTLVTAALVFQAYNGSSWIDVLLIQSATKPYCSIPYAGDIIPYDDGVPSLGDTSHYFDVAWLENLNMKGAIDFTPLVASGNPEVTMDSGDSLQYDATNNRFLFYIGGSVVGYVDASGFHDGAP